MCAGAVREAVFSVPAVIRRINADFVPVTLNMLSPLMESDDDEDRLFQSICRSRVQPQGTCVLNTGGQVLTWVLTYDKDQSVLDFLDHSLKRFRKHPDAKRPIVTERYMQFPSGRVKDSREEAKPAALAKVHATGTRCFAKGRQPPGTFVAKVIGRALDENGKLGSEALKAQAKAQDEVAFLPAGRPIDMACGVRYGIIGEPIPDDEVGKPETASQTPAPTPGSALPHKMQRLQAAIRKWQQDGKDLTPVRKIMQQFGPLVKQGKPKEAEAVLDKALKLLDETK